MAGNLAFNRPGNNDAAIVNAGTITAAEAGLVTLVAPRVDNRGIITARLGKVQLAAADTFTLDLAGDGLIQVGISDEDAAKIARNAGYISAEGGLVALTATQARNIVDSLVENSGIIEAASLTRQGGKIVLGSGKTGVTVNRGVLDASGRKNTAQGGQVEVLGQHIIIGSGSLIDASGYGALDPEASGTAAMTADKAVKTEEEFMADTRRAGGSILIGGDYLGTGDTPHALTLYVDENSLTLNNALGAGDAGRTIFWSDDTTEFNGLVLARGGEQGGNGGFLETSGKLNLLANGFADLTANEDFAKGSYLLDPQTITIYGNVDPQFISTDNAINLDTSLVLWLDPSDRSAVTLTYSTNGLGGATASGTSGSHTIITSTDVSSQLAVGARIRLTGTGAVTTADTLGTDTYTITAISGTTITVQEALSQTYNAGTSLYRGLVSGWTDKNDIGNNAAQSTASAMPLWVSGALNDLDTIRFDGTNDYMTVLDSSTLDNTDGLSFFAVNTAYNLDNATARAILSKRQGVSTQHSYGFFYFTGNHVDSYIRGNNDLSASSATYTNGVTNLIGVVYDGTLDAASRIKYYDRGFLDTVAADSDVSIPDYASDLTLGTLQSGYAATLGADFSDTLIYRKALTTNERNLVEQYQSAKWGIALDPLAGAGTEIAEATAHNSANPTDAATNGYNIFSTRYLERLAGSADLLLQSATGITLDLKGDTLDLTGGSAAGKSITLKTDNGDITDVSSGTIRTTRTGSGAGQNGNISLIAGGSGNITLDSILLEALNGGEISLSAGGNITTTGGAITHNGSIVINAGNDLDLKTFGLRSNNGNITLTAGQDAALSTSVNAGTGAVNVTAGQNITVTPHDLTTNLAGYWAFEEGSGTTAEDSAANNDGVLTGGPVWSTETPFNLTDDSSLSLDGSDDFVALNTNFGKTNTLTISLWFKTDSATGEVLFGQSATQAPGVGGGYAPSIAILTDGKIRAEYWTSSLGSIQTSESYNDGEWHYVSFVGNVNNQSLYVDGDLIGSRAGALNHAYWNVSQIGTGFDGGTRYIGVAGWQYASALIDDVRIYNTALSASDTAQLYSYSPHWNSGITTFNAGQNVTLNGALTATSSGNALTIATGQGFVNNAGASALNATNGRWLIYSPDSASNTLDGLTADFSREGSTYSGYPPGSVTETGNGLLYASGTAPLTSPAIPQTAPTSSPSSISLPKSVQQQMQQPLTPSPLLDQGSNNKPSPEISRTQENLQETGTNPSNNNYNIYSNTSDPDAGIRMTASGDLVIEKSVIDLFGLCTADSRYCKR
ncbi:MAG: LamG domain-containing protein [Alphaproteobacteria bacterium]|nr:LamG domain-containing protein [Alphaproteobacteria bacterium]